MTLDHVPAGRVLVVGAGVAGTSAALAAARRGARVTVLDGGTGATTLSTGALDAWTDALDASDGAPSSMRPAPLPPEARVVLDALDAYILDETARLTTAAGVVRRATGHDAALLNVAPFETGRVAVARCVRPGWSADDFARSWGRAFRPIDVAVLRHVGEDMLPDADFAACHDDDARLVWLAQRIREALARSGGTWDAVLLPPLLGVERARARDLAQRVGLPCGETLGSPGGPSGLRFERARRRALEANGIDHERARVRAVVRRGDRWIVTTEEDATFEGQAVVLATGNLVGGGIDYAPAEATLATALPAGTRVPFRLTIDVGATIGAFRRPLEAPSSLFGEAPESVTSPRIGGALFERVGVLAGPSGSVDGEPGLFAAGEVVADRPRTWLAALVSGARAGVAAAVFVAPLAGASATPSPSSAEASPSRP